MERRALRRAVALAAIVATVAGGGWWWARRTGSAASAPASERLDAAVKPIVPAGTRIRVEVLNATQVRGLARRATLYLRDLGFDVVRFAGDTSRRDTSLVLDRTDHPEWASLMSQALGGAPVQSRADSSRYVDITVLIGSSWRPPAKPFYP
jgi:hypothetical protein